MNKEYQQMKSIQKELTEMSMDLHNAPLRRVAMSTENEYKDPSAWFRPDPDIWAPPTHRDPDVFAPPIDRYVTVVTIKINEITPNHNFRSQLFTGAHSKGQTRIDEVKTVETLKQNRRVVEKRRKKAQQPHSQIQHETINDQRQTVMLNLVKQRTTNRKKRNRLKRKENSRPQITWKAI